jgi:Di-haem oxidoreductase, putative peroxidase
MMTSPASRRPLAELSMRTRTVNVLAVSAGVWALLVVGRVTAQSRGESSIGREVAVAHHLADDDEFRVPLTELLAHGHLLFAANWTDQEGGGRPLMKGTGKDLSDPSKPLVGNRAFNRISGPDSNSCAGCHNAPYGITGGGGDFVTNVFVMAQRFDFVTFERDDAWPTRSSTDETKQPIRLDTVGNSRATPGMFGAGYLEMLAREITTDLHAIRDSMKLGETRQLVSKGISFGELTRRTDGMWDTSKVQGMGRLSLLAPTPIDRPTLMVRFWHQASNVISLREFTNTSFNHHHGIQSTERFGRNTDPDGDGFMNEMTRADVTAVSVYQATLAVPGRVIPNNPAIEAAVLKGESSFKRIGCATCHVPALPLTKTGWIYTEPNPFNPPTNLRPGDAKTLSVDLNDQRLPQPRLAPSPTDPNAIMVEAYTDFKLHDITDPDDPDAAEPIDMNQSLVSPRLRGGNRRFVTKRLWGAANEPPFYHHGRFTTLRQAVLAHHGEALNERRAFELLPPAEQDALIEFLKTLQVLRPGTTHLIVDEKGQEKKWPPS